MSLSIVIASMILLVMLNNMLETPICGECGKRFQHARDCPTKK